MRTLLYARAQRQDIRQSNSLSHNSADLSNKAACSRSKDAVNNLSQCGATCSVISMIITLENTVNIC